MCPQIMPSRQMRYSESKPPLELAYLSGLISRPVRLERIESSVFRCTMS